jgi:hypothetical protein
VVPVTINGRGPFRFIVDTGANHSTISPQLVRALKLETEQGPMVTLDGITGAGQVSYVAIDSLRAGDFTIEDTVLPVVAESVIATFSSTTPARSTVTGGRGVPASRPSYAIRADSGTSARSRTRSCARCATTLPRARAGATSWSTCCSPA